LLLGDLTVLNLFIAGVAFALGLFLLLDRKGDVQRLVFGLLTTMTAVWVLANYFGNVNLFQLVLLDYASGSLLVFLLWLFSLVTKQSATKLGESSKILASIPVIAASAATLLLVGLIVSGLIVTTSIADTGMKVTSDGGAYVLYLIYVSVLGLFSVYNLSRAYTKSINRLQKTRVRLVIVGLSVAFVCIAIPNLILQNIFPYRRDVVVLSYESAYAGLLIFLAISTYAIVKHGLFDIKLAAVRSAAYVLAVLTLSLVYLVVAYLVSLLLFHGQVTSDISLSPVNILLALLLSFIFQPIKHFFDKITDNIFYRDSYNTEAFFAELSKLLTTTTDLKTLLEKASKDIATTFKAEYASFHLYHSDTPGDYLAVGTKRKRILSGEDTKILDDYVSRSHAEIILAEHVYEKNPKIWTMLKDNHIELIMPLRQSDKSIGYLLVGEHLSDTYSEKDISVLLTISNQLVIAIQNALSIHKVRELNATLRQRVHVETVKVRSSNGELGRVNQEMYMRNLELAQTNKTLSLLRSIDKLVLELQGSTTELVNGIAYEIRNTTSYPFVAILAHDKQKKDTLKVYGWDSSVSVNQPSHDFLDTMEIPEQKIELLQSEDSSTNISVAAMIKRRNGFSATHDGRQFVSVLQSVGVKSLFSIKLQARGRLVGLMIVGLVSEESVADKASNDEDLIVRLGGAVGIALDNKLLLEENEHVVKQLQKSNEKLKALDETKDEFLSMASHQLRTPLTSIKGYVSMVLEGDAGRVTPQQQKLLVEAFKSSERMVGLIGDFLNVSRLQTGKFLIEKAPFDLKKVVKEEIADLDVIAESHSLKLKLKTGSGHFPVVADESKLRQVVMNFVDNAIYYSKANSTIVVNLENVNGNAALTVVDTGIGVPQAEQDHLFTKFFRAQNARKQRPDGTGVGLFLARKVITEHNGSIIFSSKEGKGSTFGFKIPLEEDQKKEPRK
jgi:signal transduction histidine kinase